MNEWTKKWMNAWTNEVLGNTCAHRLNWVRITYWRWWYEWDGSALQTQDSKFEPWRSEGECASSRLSRLPTILNLYEWAGKKYVVSLEPECHGGAPNHGLRRSKQAALTTAPGLWELGLHFLNISKRFFRYLVKVMILASPDNAHWEHNLCGLLKLRIIKGFTDPVWPICAKVNKIPLIQCDAAEPWTVSFNT